MILVTGGAGYIGSHTCIALADAGYDVLIVDDLSNSAESVVQTLCHLAQKRIPFVRANVCDVSALCAIFEEYPIEAVIHFAGYKAVGESVQQPLRYYRNNLDGTLSLLEAMQRFGIKKFIFSSSATVYSPSNPIPYVEDGALGCTNPYGWTKRMSEQFLCDVCQADAEFSVALLRYFNPIGAHPSGQIGESPRGVPNNLMPYIAQVATGQREKLFVYGGDYPTVDGTGVRDYIHVMDLARGHVAALEYLKGHRGAEAINLGTGQGYSVLQIVQHFEAAAGVSIPYEIVGRRPGDIAEYYANADKARRLLGWQAECGVRQMCEDVWRFVQAQRER